MQAHNLSSEITGRLIEAIEQLYQFAADNKADPMATMCLHRAILYLEPYKKPPYRLPVRAAFTEGEFEDFVSEILLSKPSPFNSNIQQKGN